MSGSTGMVGGDDVLDGRGDGGREIGHPLQPTPGKAVGRGVGHGAGALLGTAVPTAAALLGKAVGVGGDGPASTVGCAGAAAVGMGCTPVAAKAPAIRSSNALCVPHTCVRIRRPHALADTGHSYIGHHYIGHI